MMCLRILRPGISLHGLLRFCLPNAPPLTLRGMRSIAISANAVSLHSKGVYAPICQFPLRADRSDARLIGHRCFGKFGSRRLAKEGSQKDRAFLAKCARETRLRRTPAFARLVQPLT